MFSKVFETLAEEDYVFMDDRDEEDEFPKFGGPDADYEEVENSFIVTPFFLTTYFFYNMHV